MSLKTEHRELKNLFITTLHSNLRAIEPRGHCYLISTIGEIHANPLLTITRSLKPFATDIRAPGRTHQTSPQPLSITNHKMKPRLRPSLIPQCLSCARSYVEAGTAGWKPLFGASGQTRSVTKDKSIAVQLLKPLPGYGKPGTLYFLSINCS